MRILNTVYVSDHRARVTVSYDVIEVRRGRTLAARFPMHGIEALVLTGHADMTNEALARCVRRGIRVASLSGSGAVRFMVGGATKGNVLLRVAQLRAADDPGRTLGLGRMFVAGKLQNQRRMIQRWSWDAPQSTRRFFDEQRAVVEERLGALGTKTNGDAVRGIEGDASRRYFKALGGHLERVAPAFPFVQRSRRPPLDPFNALISYLYGLLTIEAVGALDAAGLDPQVGYLHRLRPGRPSLALDLIEEFRASVADRFAVGAIARRMITIDHFVVLPGGAYALTDEGRRTVVRLYDAWRSEETTHLLLRQSVPRSTLVTTQATLLARHLRGDLPAYPPYVIGA